MALAGTQSAAVEKQLHCLTQPTVLFRRRCSANEQRQALGHPDDEDEKLLCAYLRVSQFDASPIGVGAECLLDVTQAAMAIVLDKQLCQLWEARSLSNEQPMERQRRRLQREIEHPSP